MNDKSQKIYDLAKEAGLIEFETLSWNPDLQSPNPESVVKASKFAELIVQECMNVLYDNELWNTHISHALHEHFGIE